MVPVRFAESIRWAHRSERAAAHCSVLISRGRVAGALTPETDIAGSPSVAGGADPSAQ